MSARRAIPLALLVLALLPAAASPSVAAPPPVAASPSVAAPSARPAFTVVILGASGGLDESDLTSVLVTRAGSAEFIALDAGTLWSGMVRAERAGNLPSPPSPGPEIGIATPLPLSPEARALTQNLHGYFLSHPHFDHIAGLIIASPDDSKKPIYGLPATLDALREHVFNGRMWANFTDEGSGAIGRYHFVRMKPGQPVSVAGSVADAALTVEAHPLSHGKGSDSTAFLVASGPEHLLYLGDTGADQLQGAGRLAALWDRVAPLIRAHRLRAIFLESSYADPRPEPLLFNHLTPKWITQEMDHLAARVDPRSPATALAGLTLVITHIKPVLQARTDVRADIKRQLAPLEARGMRVIVPHSGERLDL